MKSLFISCGLLVTITAQAVTVRGTTDDPPPAARVAAREILVDRFSFAPDDTAGWQMHWRIDPPPDKTSLSLGSPHRVYRLNNDKLSDVARTGDLLRASEFLWWEFPVFRGEHMIGHIAVSQSDKGWVWAEQSATSLLDSLVAAQEERLGGRPGTEIVVVYARTSLKEEFVLTVVGDRPATVIPVDRRLLVRMGIADTEYHEIDYDDVVEPLKAYAGERSELWKKEHDERE